MAKFFRKDARMTTAVAPFPSVSPRVQWTARQRACWEQIVRRQTSPQDRKSTRLNSSHGYISYAVVCLKQKQRKYSLVYHKLSFTLVFHPRDRVGATSGRVVMLTASQRL